MDWLLKNPQIIIFLIFGVIAIVGKIAKARKDQQAKQGQLRPPVRPVPTQQAQPSRSFETSTMDSAEAERTRRIQEEVRRKILARMQGKPVQNAPAIPRPPIASVRRAEPTATFRRESTPPPPLPVQKSSAAKPMEDESIAAYKSASAQIAELQEMARKSAATVDPAFANVHTDLAAVSPVSESAQPEFAENEIVSDLRNPRALRRAFVMREILDKPVSLR